MLALARERFTAAGGEFPVQLHRSPGFRKSSSLSSFAFKFKFQDNNRDKAKDQDADAARGVGRRQTFSAGLHHVASL